jgi:4-amino-4-deoxy-L-arabinose transferase-like glycosyltransferase
VSARARPRWLSVRAPVLGLLALGVMLRLWGAAAHWQWFDQQHPLTWEKSKLELSPDANQYIQQADPDTWPSSFYRSWSEQAYFRPPLASYYFVGLFRAVGFDRVLAATAQALLAALAYLLLFLSVARVCGRTIALVSLAAIAAHPVLMFYDVSFEDSTLALALLSATLYLVLWARDGSPWRWLLPGTSAGLTLLARPSLFVAAAGIAVLILGWAGQRRAKAVLAFGFSLAYVVAPVLWHNHAVSGRWVPIVDSAGPNLFWGNSQFSDYRLSVQGYWNIREVDTGSPAALLIQGLMTRTGQESSEPAYRAAAVSFLTSHPGQALAGLLDKTWRHLSSYEIPRNTNFQTQRQNVLVWRLPYAPFSVLLVLALIGGRGLDKRLTWLFLLPWLAALFSEVVFFNASRYRALCVPFLIPLAIRALQMGYAAVKARAWRRPLLGAAAVVVVWIVGAFAISSAERTRYQAVDHFKDAMLESYAGEYGAWRRFSEERFRRYLDGARRLDPQNLDVFVLVQKYLISQGKSYAALAMIDYRETQCRPEEWLCHEVCGYLRGMVGRRGAAAGGPNPVRLR